MKPVSESSNFPDIFEQLQAVDPGLYSRTIRVRGRNPKYVQVYDSVLDRIQQAKRKGETELDLSHLNLTELPDELFELTTLTSLDISENQLNALPEKIGLLNKLTILSVHDNPIEIIDDSIGQLNELRSLLLHGCKLSKFPKGILTLSHLQILDITNNAIKWIPVGLKDMEKLEEIMLTGNPILNLPVQFHETTSARLFNYYKDIASSANVHDPLILSIYFEPSHGEIKNIEGDRFAEFNPEAKKLLLDAHVISKSISNPDGENLFNQLYQYLDLTKIFYILAKDFKEIQSLAGPKFPVTPGDFTELFACLPERKLKTRILILDFENAWSTSQQWDLPDFNVLLVKNTYDQLQHSALFYALFQDLLGRNSLAYSFKKMLKKDNSSFVLSFQGAQDFDKVFHSPLLSEESFLDISNEEFYRLLLVNLLSYHLPKKETAYELVKKVGMNPKLIGFSENPEIMWENILQSAEVENKISQLLNSVKKEYPTVAKIIDLIHTQPEPPLSKREATKRQKELIKSGYKITADGIWGPQSETAWNEYQLKKSVKE